MTPWEKESEVVSRCRQGDETAWRLLTSELVLKEVRCMVQASTASVWRKLLQSTNILRLVFPRLPAWGTAVAAVVVLAVGALVLQSAWPKPDPWMAFNALPKEQGIESTSSAGKGEWVLPDYLQLDLANNRVRFGKPPRLLSGTTTPMPTDSSDGLKWNFKASGEITPGVAAELEGTLVSEGGAMTEIGKITAEAMIRVPGATIQFDIAQLWTQELILSKDKYPSKNLMKTKLFALIALMAKD